MIPPGIDRLFWSALIAGLALRVLPFALLALAGVVAWRVLA
jgi:hypothetical protein